MSVQANLKEVATKFAVAALSRSGGQLDAGMNSAFQELVDAGVSEDQFNDAMKQANHDYVAGVLNGDKSLHWENIDMRGEYIGLINAARQIENPVVKEAAKEFVLSILGSEVRGIAHDIYGRKIDRNDAWIDLAQNAVDALRAAVKGDFTNAGAQKHGDDLSNINRIARDYHFGTRDRQIGTAAKLLKLAVLEHGTP